MTHDSAGSAPLNPPDPSSFRIKSFARRQGRITPAQQKALDELWELYGLEPDSKLVPEIHFGNQNPIVLEIGFGNGDSLVEMAQNDPDRNYVGIEVHRPGVGHRRLNVATSTATNDFPAADRSAPTRSCRPATVSLSGRNRSGCAPALVARP